ncbi:competence protein ComEA [Paenibacillus taihuensis]|uniref:Competence protein ComEA n=1 Tax=Paenibacillus taihuensis TaxID=1156355 RepID=A0A3D9SMG5_9BACL|nr:helix-hairpin-helix domain-containing protein [Paenibacillus taihuensis]REE93095.1 competence protein ComEA [Paenibacillus taihuensis]
MRTQARMKLDPQKLLIIGLLIAAVALVCTALYRPERDGQPGWAAVNEQVKQTIGPIEKVADSSADAAKNDEKKRQQTRSKVSANASASARVSAGATGASAKDDGGETVSSDGKVDINHATVEQLDALPGIGASKAKAIMADREQNGLYHSADDLLRVKGIGPKLLEKLKSFIVLQP